MNAEAREIRARRAKQVFEFMAGWEPPALGGEPPSSTKNALLQGSPGLVQILMDMISSEEGEALAEWQAYRETISSHEFTAKGGLGVSEHAAENIYDVLLILLELYGDNNVPTLYRGHRDSSWKLRASYYRSSAAAWQRRVEMEAKLMQRETEMDDLRSDELEARIEQLRKLYPNLELADLSPLQKEAAVQHYLSGTKLLDFTYSMYVAAFFATKPASGSGSANSGLGAIYTVGDIEAEKEGLAVIKVVELPDRFARIHRQNGVFLRIRSVMDFEHPALWWRWLFHQTQAASPFECDRLGITADYLLSEQT
jgi:hypothetical protein